MTAASLLAALKAFDATARAGSMTAAARVLGLQQPTLSAHIQRLEQTHAAWSSPTSAVRCSSTHAASSAPKTMPTRCCWPRRTATPAAW
jgi:hypothetical protein